MDIKQAKLILQKINRLYDTMTLDDRVDEFEQDLMLAYIKQLYDSFSNEKEVIPQPIQRRKPPQLVNGTQSSIAPVVEETPPPPPPAEPEIPRASTKVNPVVVEEEEEIELHEAVIPASEPIYEQSNPEEPLAAKSNPVIPSLDKKVAKLFEFEIGSDLSDRLSLQPIADLTKAFGINEKMLSINELFGKDAVFFEGILERLNRLSNFNDAKYVLAQIADKYGWAEEDKRKKAIIFIKKVYRKYL